MKSVVFDSYALLAFLFQEKGHEKVASLMDHALDLRTEILIASPNWAEVRYILERKLGSARWRETRAMLLALPIHIVAADMHLAELAGELKATRKMSLADCFAAALAKERKVELFTGDPELKAVENELKVVWL